MDDAQPEDCSEGQVWNQRDKDTTRDKRAYPRQKSEEWSQWPLVSKTPRHPRFSGLLAYVKVVFRVYVDLRQVAISFRLRQPMSDW